MRGLSDIIHDAELGSVDAMYELGMMYYSGDGIAEDEELAMKWLKRAAVKGDEVSKELYDQWNAEKHEAHLQKLLGEDYLSKYGKAVVLHCPACGEACTVPLEPINKWMNLAAWNSSWDKVKLEYGYYKVGKKLRVRMAHPFYCKIGDTFSISFGDYFSRFITCRLLGIIRIEDSWAEISVKVLSEGTCLFFVNHIDILQKEKMAMSKDYLYCPSWSRSCDLHKLRLEGIRLNDHYFYCFENFGGSDEVYRDYIYTDDDGIDHHVHSTYDIWHANESFYGDKVLGYHINCPFEVMSEESYHKRLTERYSRGKQV